MQASFEADETTRQAADSARPGRPNPNPNRFGVCPRGPGPAATLTCAPLATYNVHAMMRVVRR